MNLTKDTYDLIINHGYGRERIQKVLNITNKDAEKLVTIAKYLQINNIPVIDDPQHKDSAIKSLDIKGETLRLAVMSDLHFGSAVCKIAEMKSFFNYALDKKVDVFLMSGDLLDGQRVYKGQEFEQDAVSADGQFNLFMENVPQLPKAYFIIGNHEYSLYKHAGKNIGYDIAKERKDFEYLGCMEGNVKINDILFQLWHGAGSCSYSISYKLQKKIETYVPGHKPRFLFAGHWHQSLEMTTRNVSAYHCGSFQGSNTFSKALALATIVGGWILEIIHHDGEVKSVKSEFVQYY